LIVNCFGRLGREMDKLKSEYETAGRKEEEQYNKLLNEYTERENEFKKKEEENMEQDKMIKELYKDIMGN